MTTAEEELEQEIHERDNWCTVVGLIVESDERWFDYYPTPNARTAEDEARAEMRTRGATLKVTAVFPGKLGNIDGYAKYTDPDRV